LPDLPIGARTVGHAGIRKYDLSPDGRYVVVDARDDEGKSRIWLAPVDGKSPPRQLVDLEANTARFGSDGRILFRAKEGAYGFAYAVDVDGTGLTKLDRAPGHRYHRRLS
jgi:hypothetical protein